MIDVLPPKQSTETPVPGMVYKKKTPHGATKAQYMTVLAVDVDKTGGWTALGISVSHGMFRLYSGKDDLGRLYEPFALHANHPFADKNTGGLDSAEILDLLAG